jgi:hypothetical protein
MEKNEMFRGCSIYKGKESCVPEFWWGTLQERDQLEDPGVDERRILKWLCRKWGYGLDRAGSG